jgi:hypothetical protein
VIDDMSSQHKSVLASSVYSEKHIKVSQSVCSYVCMAKLEKRSEGIHEIYFEEF